jgi:glycosyltransferase involved in cell wall biosynthesis
MDRKIKIAILDPFLGSSHKEVWDNYKKNSTYYVEVYPYSNKNWKLSSGLSAFTPTLKESFDLSSFDIFLVSEYFDISSFKGMNSFSLDKKFICYFHENQFEYPVLINDKRDDQYSIINLKNYLCADLVIFNSKWNKESFIKGIKRFRRALPSYFRNQIPDSHTLATREQKKESLVLYPGHSLSKEVYTEYLTKNILEKTSRDRPNKDTLKVIWNHRWEHDKGLDLLYNVIEKVSNLDSLDISFDICGEEIGNSRFKNIFSKFGTNLISNIGFYKSKRSYYEALSKSDVVLSTANHEFYGISILEGVLLGAIPLLPNKLSYPEIYSDDFPKCFYESEDDLVLKLKDLCKKKNQIFQDELNISDNLEVRKNFYKNHNSTLFCKNLDKTIERLFK